MFKLVVLIALFGWTTGLWVIALPLMTTILIGAAFISPTTAAGGSAAARPLWWRRLLAPES